MADFRLARFNNEIILLARILMVVLFLSAGWEKLIDYQGTVQHMVQASAPLPRFAALAELKKQYTPACAGCWG